MQFKKKKIFLSFGYFDERNKFELFPRKTEEIRIVSCFTVEKSYEVDAKEEKRKRKRGKVQNACIRVRTRNVVQRDTYVRTPFINNVTWWYIDLKPRCYAGSEERVWSRTM